MAHTAPEGKDRHTRSGPIGTNLCPDPKLAPLDPERRLSYLSMSALPTVLISGSHYDYREV